jgi:hypothetical protein
VPSGERCDLGGHTRISHPQARPAYPTDQDILGNRRRPTEQPRVRSGSRPDRHSDDRDRDRAPGLADVDPARRLADVDRCADCSSDRFGNASAAVQVWCENGRFG